MHHTSSADTRRRTPPPGAAPAHATRYPLPRRNQFLDSSRGRRPSIDDAAPPDRPAPSRTLRPAPLLRSPIDGRVTVPSMARNTEYMGSRLLGVLEHRPTRRASQHPVPAMRRWCRRKRPCPRVGSLLTIRASVDLPDPISMTARVPPVAGMTLRRRRDTTSPPRCAAGLRYISETTNRRPAWLFRSDSANVRCAPSAEPRPGGVLVLRA